CVCCCYSSGSAFEVEKRWRDRPEWIELAKEKLCTMFKHYCKEFRPLVATELTSISTTALMHSESMLRHGKYGSTSPTPHRDELDYYLHAALEPEDVYPMDYWKANKLKYLNLASIVWN